MCVKISFLLHFYCQIFSKIARFFEKMLGGGHKNSLRGGCNF